MVGGFFNPSAKAPVELAVLVAEGVVEDVVRHFVAVLCVVEEQPVLAWLGYVLPPVAGNDAAPRAINAVWHSLCWNLLEEGGVGLRCRVWAGAFSAVGGVIVPRHRFRDRDATQAERRRGDVDVIEDGICRAYADAVVPAGPGDDERDAD